MALDIPVGFGSVILSHVSTGDPEPYAITFGVDISANSGDHQGTVNNIFNWWVAEEQIYASHVLLSKAILYVGQAVGPPAVYESTLPAVAGTGGSANLPQNNAALVTKRSALAGRRNKGRFYLPYVLPETAVSEQGVITTAHRNGLQTAMNTFFNKLATGDGATEDPYPMVILHGDGLGPTPAPTPVTSLVVESVIATQRLRLRK